MERAAAVGVALLLFLFVFLTYNDIRRLFGG
jgi:membrane-associated protease RseP (regulator of RpoE activity)